MNLPGKMTTLWMLPRRPVLPTSVAVESRNAKISDNAQKVVEAASAESGREEEEAAWVCRAQAGEIAAFDWLMQRYRERAIRLAAHILRRPSEAEDLAQEAFLRAFGQIRAFRGDAAFYTWLYRIVVRACLNHMRTPNWNREHNALLDESYLIGIEPSGVTQSENRLLIEALLDNLSPPLRAALVLRELEGLSYEEIAETLEVPVGTVRSRLNAARAQFRALWQKAMEEANHV